MKILQGGHQDRQRARARDGRVRLPAAPVLPCTGEPPHLQCGVISQAHQHSHSGHLLMVVPVSDFYPLYLATERIGENYCLCRFLVPILGVAGLCGDTYRLWGPRVRYLCTPQQTRAYFAPRDTHILLQHPSAVYLQRHPYNFGNFLR